MSTHWYTEVISSAKFSFAATAKLVFLLEIYYLTAEGCKFGKSCHHSMERSEISLTELNPCEDLQDKEKEIVESVEQTSDIECKGEKECESYMHTGSCGYGVTCRFHHPVPVAAEVSKPFNSTCSGAFMRGHSLGNHNLESFTSQSKRSSVSHAATVSSDKISLKTVSCLSNHSFQAVHLLLSDSLSDKI
ncbi:hypothetical protein DKX38_025332 [Salix brachista]|uniref:C3H1-type domain-containing protein n=1 Tax=Salix brachista TaxID=2182728 RepID=A0A5N5JU73_9ROSI|nr:hypothetical protein DKX38_025332 [Salix brachista]